MVGAGKYFAPAEHQAKTACSLPAGKIVYDDSGDKLMLGASYKIMTVWGIPIKIHISLIVLLVILAFAAERAGGTMAILEVLRLPVMVFICIALHELGHSFVAIRKGCRVREITLLFIGGAAQMEDIPRRPLDEIQMAIAGPLVSVFLFAALWFGGSFLPLERFRFTFPLWQQIHIIGNYVQFIGVVNLSLALFNLLPSFPMDGGRVFRAALATRLGRLRATYVAVMTGRAMAVAFGVSAIFFSANWFLLVIAFFIFTAAGNEYRMVKMQEEAKQRGGFNLWPPIYDEPPPLPRDDRSGNQVIISPPPYEKGPTRKTAIHSTDEDDPFRDMFGHS
jgi:Zn-dependent protease